MSGAELLFITWSTLDGWECLRQGPDFANPGPDGLTLTPAFPFAATAQHLVAGVALRTHGLVDHEAILCVTTGRMPGMTTGAGPSGGAGSLPAS